MRCRLLLKEYGHEIEFIKDPKKPKQGDIVDDINAVLPFVPVDENTFPVHLMEIQAKQAKDLRQKVKIKPSYLQKTVVE